MTHSISVPPWCRCGIAAALALAMLATATPGSAGPLDAFWPYLWWVHRLEAPTAWREIGPGPRILVAIIDSGVDLGHPDLADRILRDAAGRPLGYNFADRRRPIDDPTDLDGHGTHVAGIIAALTRGIADRVRLLPLKVTDAQGRPSLYAVTEALELARLMRADIVNISLATDLPAYEFEQALRAAGEAEARTAHRRFVAKWKPLAPKVAASLLEAREELLTFYRFPASQWKALRTTNAIERLHEEFRRGVKTQGALPDTQTAEVLLFGLLASGQIRMRRLDGWQDMDQIPVRRSLKAA